LFHNFSSLSLVYLIYFVKDLKKNLDENFSKAGILHGLSLEIIKKLLGIEWIKFKNGKSFRLLKFKEERNFKSKIINIWDETFFSKYSEIKSYNNWINLNDII